MIRIKSYSKIWKAEGTLYSVGDVNLPFSMKFSSVGWFIGSMAVMFTIGDVFPLSLFDFWLLKYIAIPAGITYLMSKVEFEGKNPLEYMISYILYYLRPKLTYRGKAIKEKKKYTLNEEITFVRSEKISELPD